MDNLSPEQKPESFSAPSLKHIFTASAVALVIAVAVLVVAVLPAEFGVDPLGTGRAMGLLDLADAGNSPLEHQLTPHKTDFVEFILEPFQSVEYKYQLQAEHSMIFSWQASGDLVFDMHADPNDLGVEFVESFEQGTASSSMGVYHAPFAGIHGWFWENRGFQEVVLRLYSAGFYDSSIVFRDGGSFERTLPALIE